MTNESKDRYQTESFRCFQDFDLPENRLFDFDEIKQLADSLLSAKQNSQNEYEVFQLAGSNFILELKFHKSKDEIEYHGGQTWYFRLLKSDRSHVTDFDEPEDLKNYFGWIK